MDERDRDRNRWGSDDSSWDANRRLITSGLDRLQQRLDDIDQALRKLEIELAIMRTKVALFSSLTGAIGGFVTSFLTMLLVHYVSGK